MKKSCRIYLVRHGQTDWNKEKVFRGLADRPLSDAGRAEALAVGEALKDEPVDFIYASPLKRARQTVEPLARWKRKRIRPAPGLIDIDYGEWSGLAEAAAQKAYPKLYKAWRQRPETVTFPHGESLARVARRALVQLKELAALHPGQTVVVASHRVVCKVIALKLLGLPLRKFWDVKQDIACLNLFEYAPPRAIVLLLNDTCHLKALPSRITADF
jgi:broad specificity phosphatase PhoE